MDWPMILMMGMAAAALGILIASVIMYYILDWKERREKDERIKQQNRELLRDMMTKLEEDPDWWRKAGPPPEWKPHPLDEKDSDDELFREPSPLE